MKTEVKKFTAEFRDGASILIVKHNLNCSDVKVAVYSIIEDIAESVPFHYTTLDRNSIHLTIGRLVQYEVNGKRRAKMVLANYPHILVEVEGWNRF